MQNIKYHFINIATMLIFSFALASTINLVVEYKLSPNITSAVKKQPDLKPTESIITKRPFEFYSSILDSGFFFVTNVVVADNAPSNEPPPVEVIDIAQLSLLGTITGPAAIARAMIRKQGEKTPDIFALRKIDDDISYDVHGYKLVWIGDTKVTLEANGEKQILDMYPEKTPETPPASGILPPKTTTAVASGPPIKTTISRAEIKQKVMNNLDEAMKGLVAGPYRKNNVIEGFLLNRIPTANILYTLGARNGDIVKRINGKTMDSTEKLLQMWQGLTNENKVTIDLERSGKLVTYEINITN
jgi:general secretion pathway protein C